MPLATDDVCKRHFIQFCASRFCSHTVQCCVGPRTLWTLWYKEQPFILPQIIKHSTTR